MCICLYFTGYFGDLLHDCFFPEDIFALKKSVALRSSIESSEKCHKIHRKTTVPESLLNKIVGLQPRTLLTKKLMRRCLPVYLATILKTVSFIEYL